MFYSFQPPFYYVISFTSEYSTVHTGTITGNTKRLFDNPPRPAAGPKSILLRPSLFCDVT